MPRICVFTHREPSVVGSSIAELVQAARDRDVELVATAGEASKHPMLGTSATVVSDTDVQALREVDAGLVLAGDGTLLRVLNQLRDGPPVLGVNYGLLGYLSGLSDEHVSDAIGCLADGDFETVELPTLTCRSEGGEHFALNDVVASGGVTGRIIEVCWRIVSPQRDGSERTDSMGVIPCDGMVIATPVGSTAYNLSNGGPVVAWGVGGYVVSFIAPHTLAARPLVVQPGHEVELEHMGRGASLKLLVDGHHIGTLAPGERLRVGIGTSVARLALVDDKSFYARYRDSFAAQIQSFDDEVVRRPTTAATPARTRRAQA